MTATIPVFVNDRLVQVPSGTPASQAVATHDAELANRLARGEAYLTDGRGIRLAPDLAVFSGAILRVVVSARDGREETDAHP
jgi:hypothetical protein